MSETDARLSSSSADEQALLAAYAKAGRPTPLAVILGGLNPVPRGWAVLRLFAPVSPWHDRNDVLQAVTENLVERGLLVLTRARRLSQNNEYEITDAGRRTVAGAE